MLDPIGYELLVAADRDGTNSSSESRLWRGDGGATSQEFHTGPHHSDGARERFFTTDTDDHEFLLTFDSDALDSSSTVQLCGVTYRVLSMPDQVDLVLEDGSRARFEEQDDGGTTKWVGDPGSHTRRRPDIW